MSDLNLNDSMKAALGELTFDNIVKLQQLKEMAARIRELEAEVAKLTPEKSAD